MTNSVAMGGMEEHVRLLAREVDRHRYEVWATAPQWEPTEQFSTGLAEAADCFVPATPDRRHGLPRQLAETWRLFRLGRRQRFDVAHLHSTSFDGLAAAIIALKLAGVRRIFVTEHLAPATAVSRPSRWKRAAVIALVSGLVCVSENNRDARARFLGIPRGRTHVVNNGIDVRRFDGVADASRLDALKAELGIAPDAPVVGTAIRFEPGKGIADLVAAFADVHARHSTSVLLMVGDGTLRPQLEAQVTQLGLADATRFVGFQSDPRPYILLMDAFVLPVPFGSASIALLEAMAMSRPCVITFGGDREAVQHGVSGFCAAPNDPRSIAESVNALFDSGELRLEIGRAARARVESDYSAVRVAREAEQLYAGR